MPLLPTTIRSAPTWSATLTIASAASPAAGEVGPCDDAVLLQRAEGLVESVRIGTLGPCGLLGLARLPRGGDDPHRLVVNQAQAAAGLGEGVDERLRGTGPGEVAAGDEAVRHRGGLGARLGVGFDVAVEQLERCPCVRCLP